MIKHEGITDGILYNAPQKIENWVNCTSEEMNQCFFKRQNGNQYQRLSGFDFEKIHPDLYDDIMEDKTLSLTLGVRHVLEKPEFEIFFVSTEGENKTYFGIEENKGRIYQLFKSTDDSNETATRKFGISSQLKDQLCLNWWFTPESAISNLFYVSALMHGQVTDQSNPDVIDPFNFGWKRVLNFPIVNSNKTALKQMVRQESSIKVHLGCNPSGLMQEEDMFALILEIENPESEEEADMLTQLDDGVNFLDFLRPCPPFGGCD